MDTGGEFSNVKVQLLVHGYARGKFVELRLDDDSVSRMCGPGHGPRVRQVFWDLIRRPAALECDYETRAFLHSRYVVRGRLSENLPNEADAMLQRIAIEVRATPLGERLLSRLRTVAASSAAAE